jgi:DNA-binding CsgD family transcriptional regulator/tetratricopeptide (TPR) repeat protein
MASLVQYAREAYAGEGRLVFVSGEAGIGKSSVVERLVARLEVELPGTRWAWGLCDGLFTPRPLSPLFDMADVLGGELLALCRARAPRDELFAALLRQVSEPGRLKVLVVEDLHWADEATIDLLRFLGRRLRSAPVLLIVTYRDEGLGPGDPLRIAVGELGMQQSTRRIGLEPLSASAVGLVAGDSGLDPAVLYRLTGGNPYFVAEVVRAGVAAVPGSARDAVLARLAALSDSARAALEVAALIGARFDAGLLAAVTSPGPLDELVTSGLLVADGRELRFRHELARLAVEQAIPAHRTAGIHARILAGLRAAGLEDDAAMAYHAEGAGDAAGVLEFAVRAARRAAELASHREAAAQYERALRFAGRLGVVEQAQLYDALAYELSLVDRWQEVAEAAERARSLWNQAGDRLREGATLRLLSAAMCNLCRADEAIAAAERAPATLEPLGPGPELAWAYSHLAAQYMLVDRHAEAFKFAVRASEIADALGLHEVRSDALNTQGCAVRVTNPEWTVDVQRALDIALEHGLEEQAGRAYTNLHGLLCDERRHAEADPYYVEGVAYCDEHDVATFGTSLRGERANMYVRTGRWDEAALICRQVINHAGASPINKITPLANLGLLHARGGTENPLRYLDEAAAAADGSREPQSIGRVYAMRAEAHWLAGRLDDARRDAEHAFDAVAGGNGWLRGTVAYWLRRTGSDRSRFDGLAAPYQLLLDGDWSGAASSFEDVDCPYDAALALLDADDEDALRRAVTIFDSLGAAATARVARQLLRGRGIRSIPAGRRATTREHPLGLTRREHEVLDLICAGYTDAEIAKRLFIAVKTVHHHVSAVLAKLGTSTRGAAAAEAIRLGLVTPTKP